jgi:iron complex outermembrane receptor protein
MQRHFSPTGMANFFLMGRIIICLCLVQIFITPVRAQPDTARVLDEVTVRAFAQDRAYRQVPAPVAVITGENLDRFVNVSLVPAFNMVPGVRLEERSPGSYRVAIRGSSLRAPFGVRNVKVYWNDLPMTDAGGNTYLNQLDPASAGTIEIIKGPGSSLYGAGTGGVLLFYQPPLTRERSVEMAGTVGSFGLQTRQLTLREGTGRSSHVVQYLHQQADGYRDHTRMTRDMVNSFSRFEVSDRRSVETVLLYSDLFYQTPGGLTLSEFNANPRQARPAAGALPGAQQQNAHVAQKSFYAGVLHEYKAGRWWHNRTGVYGNTVEFANAAIRNQERRAEQSFGFRSVTTYARAVAGIDLRLQGGMEYQGTFSTIGTYHNLSGATGALQSNDQIVSATGLLFTQGTAAWREWVLTAGLSANDQAIRFNRLAPAPEHRERLFSVAWMPRVALLRNVGREMSVHASLSRGFSPPTLAEIRPSTTVFNPTLQPETGTNFEAGWRGSRGPLRWDMSAYHFRLNETIVVRRDEDGADFFVNAGNTRQDGLEALLHFQPAVAWQRLKKVLFSGGITLQRYLFQNYRKIDTDFSGNRLTGVPGEIYSLAADAVLTGGFYANLSVIHTGRLPLDDANSVFAEPYTFAAWKMGWKKATPRLGWDVFAGIDNALNQTYSLGNDLNAAGGRHFNVAPGRQYFAGLRITALGNR